MDDKELQELLESVPREERAAAWEAYVRDEVNALLDAFLPEAITGNVAVKYDHPVLKKSARTGQVTLDENKATGVSMLIVFEFAAPVEFFGEGKLDEDEPEKVE